MTKFKQLTCEERRIVIKMHKEGNSYRKIAKFFDKTPACIFKIVAAYKRDGRVSVLCRSGRPKVTTNRIDKRIVNISTSSPHLSAAKIRAKLIEEGKSIPSTQTIRRRLHTAGRHGRVARILPYISKVNLKKRLQFYERHVLKSDEFWKRILWTDESMIRMRHSHGRMYVWRKCGDELSYDCVKPSLKSMDRGIMVWGCFSAYGVGQILPISGRINSTVYLKVLQEVIIPEGKRLIGDDFILQQDNAPIHKAKIVMNYLKNNNINVLDWPPQSPDLSPIENMWALLKLKIAEKKPKNINELKLFIMETWQTFTVEECTKYVLSLPHRISKMSQRKGYHCGY